MKTILSPRAKKEFKKLPKTIQIIIARKIRSIGESGPGQNTQTLKGYRNIFRLRLGDYRLVFKYSKQIMHIVTIKHRKDVYKTLRSLFK